MSLNMMTNGTGMSTDREGSIQPSLANPQYSVYITSEKGVTYNVTNALISIDHSEPEKQIAANASIDLYDVKVDGMSLLSLIAQPDRVTIKANDGTKNDDVFNGYIWDISQKDTADGKVVSLKCYDQLIYWQESEDSEFFPEGRSTDGIVKTIAKAWGINIDYSYKTIFHKKLVLRGNIADFITADVLDAVQKSTKTRYVILAGKDKVYIRSVGQNETVYTISAENNAIEARRYVTLNGVVTKVVILGTASDDSKTPVEATVTGDTDKYGTLQKIISKDEDTDLATAKKEADTIISEEGKPKWEYDVKAVDIPWIRKGDKVKIETDILYGSFIVKGVSREISNRGKIMTLTVITA